MNTVFLIDTDPKTIEKFTMLTQSVGLACKVYSNGEDFLKELGQESHGCLVTEALLPDMAAQELIKKIGENRISTIVMSSLPSVSMAVEVFRLGAVDFIEKPFREFDVIESIHRVIRASISRQTARATKQLMLDRLSTLTEREAQVANLVYNGRANKEIAKIMEISRKTVELHRGRAMKKLKAQHVSDLVKACIAAESL